MTWIRANYDRVYVLIAAVLLLASVVLIARNVWRFSQDFSAQPGSPPPRAALLPPKAIETEQASQRLRQPAQWTFNGRSGLFVPEKHFIDASGFPTTLQTTEVHPPVPNEWLEEFGLPIADGNVLNQDPDADGFSNLEEWQNQTKPDQRDSHPAFIAKLKMRSFVQEPFRLVFASRVDDTFAINSKDLKEPTQFLRLGDPIRGTKFKLLRFTEKFEPNQYGTRLDVSELTLGNQETREELTLVKEKITTSPDSVAHFVYAWRGRREFAVRKDQEFSLKPEEQIKYKLIDVQPGNAVIVNTQKPNEPIEVGLLNP